MPRENTQKPVDSAQEPQGFDPDAAPFESMVTVPVGKSVDEAIADATAASEEGSDSRFASAALTSDPEFDASEVGFPRLRLAQGLTQEVAEGNAKMGQWLFTGFDPMDSVTIVPLQFGRARNKRENPDDRDSAIACSSTDGVQGVGVPGRACKGCPFAAFSTDEKTGRRRAPACTLTYTYAVWVVEIESFGQVSFSRTSEQYAHMLNNLVKFHGMGKFAVRLTSIRKQAPGRIWAEPQIRLVRLTPEMVEATGGLIETPALPAPHIAEVTSA